MLIKFDLLNLELPNCLLCHVSRKHNYLTLPLHCRGRGQMGPVRPNGEGLHVISPVFTRPDSALHRIAWHWHWRQDHCLELADKGSGTVNVRRMVISAAIAPQNFFSCPTWCELWCQQCSGVTLNPCPRVSRDPRSCAHWYMSPQEPVWAGDMESADMQGTLHLAQVV